MKNFVKPGYTVTKTEVGAVESGAAVVCGTQLVVATGKYAAGEEGEYLRAGVVSLPKKAALAIAIGALVYWDVSTGHITTVEADGDVVAGVADKAAAGADTEVEVLLNNTPYSFNG